MTKPTMFEMLKQMFKGQPGGNQLLNLGCGACFHPEWVNVDFASGDPSVIQHDLRTPLPFGDRSCRVVYHSHVLEHFEKSFAPVFLRECHRVLVPGGVLRVVVPDLETIARLYLQNLDGALANDPQAARRHEWMQIELLDQLARERSGGEMLRYWKQNPMPAEKFVIQRMGREVLRFLEYFRSQPPAPAATAQPSDPAEVGKFRLSGEVHKWMYDRVSLRNLLESVGFGDVKVCAASESRIPEFARYGLDLHTDGTVRKPDSLFMEASKPE